MLQSIFYVLFQPDGCKLNFSLDIKYIHRIYGFLYFFLSPHKLLVTLLAPSGIQCDLCDFAPISNEQILRNAGESIHRYVSDTCIYP